MSYGYNAAPPISLDISREILADRQLKGEERQSQMNAYNQKVTGLERRVPEFSIGAPEHNSALYQAYKENIDRFAEARMNGDFKGMEDALNNMNKINVVAKQSKEWGDRAGKWQDEVGKNRNKYVEGSEQALSQWRDEQNGYLSTDGNGNLLYGGKRENELQTPPFSEQLYPMPIAVPVFDSFKKMFNKQYEFSKPEGNKYVFDKQAFDLSWNEHIKKYGGNLPQESVDDAYLAALEYYQFGERPMSTARPREQDQDKNYWIGLGFSRKPTKKEQYFIENILATRADEGGNMTIDTSTLPSNVKDGYVIQNVSIDANGNIELTAKKTFANTDKEIEWVRSGKPSQIKLSGIEAFGALNSNFDTLWQQLFSQLKDKYAETSPKKANTTGKGDTAKKGSSIGVGGLNP